ncbi:hypothetical protein [Metabacillus indicus]|uniref:GIY-YIG domain-containing protein n=1 Tax=Metabacillus indicus TaxID=246786 RepID=A0A084GIL7_METID|nr:hypothetical protein [Metabacillus indicus]KEZ47179.1 hypothetical protein GS18_0220230 [Metabacillus indicus]
MVPSKKELVNHLEEKMTNQDIGKIYNISFQKVIQLTKKYELNQNQLRKVNKLIVYMHMFNGKVVYIGSGLWYRCRRYTNRRNIEHKQLMKDGKIEYKIIAEFEDEEAARSLEQKLIKKYKSKGEATFNKQLK